MKTIIKASLASLVFAASICRSAAQGTAFTYQGRMDNNGSPANGSYDFRFRLASDSFGNNYVGSAFLTNIVQVTNGLFVATIDFGAGLFTGSNYWLEVDVRTNGAGGYTDLNPLQALTSTPYATFANTASNFTGAISAAQLSAGTANISISGSAATAVTATTANTANNFTGSLAGDVTGTQSATTVANVGVQTAANVAAGTSAANAATDANTANTIVKRDSSGNFSAGTITLNGNLLLSTTTGSGGIINSGGSTLVHSYGIGNFFAGFGAGNLTMTGDGGNSGLGFHTLTVNTTGSDNTASGSAALFDNTSGSDNTANGYKVLFNNTTGGDNTADGSQALFSNTTGSGNTASGYGALNHNTSGNNNTAFGIEALLNIATTSGNIGLGYQAGYNLLGSGNIDIGNAGVSTDNNTIRIGTASTQGTPTTAFIAGIADTTVANGVAVVVNSAGQLGITSSSARFKEKIQNMESASSILLSLRPVTFR